MQRKNHHKRIFHLQKQAVFISLFSSTVIDGYHFYATRPNMDNRVDDIVGSPALWDTFKILL